jgi:Sodium/hydrogen exchanger family
LNIPGLAAATGAQKNELILYLYAAGAHHYCGGRPGRRRAGPVATVTKLGGAYVMARRCGLDHPQSAMIGFMMNTRALMELIVLNVGLDLGVISPKLFTMLVIMAIVSTIITTPALRYFMPRAGLKLQA